MTRRKKILAGTAVVLAGGAVLAFVYRASLILFAFGMLIRPGGDFDPATAPPPPDYGDMAAWAAHPDQEDPSDWVPPGVEAPADPEKQRVDVFYIHPTGFFGKHNWNAAMDEPTGRGIPVDAMLASQASVFNGCGRVYAPRYRQATLYSFIEHSVSPEKRNGYQALELAYSDVARAFDYFVEHYSQGRPFILAGHSQGTQHGLRLLAERIDKTDLHKRMVAAYLIGGSMSSDVFERVYTNVKPCTSPTQLGSLLHWDTIQEGVEPQRSGFHYYPTGWESAEGKVRYVVNPLTWTSSEERAPATLNAGALVMALDGELAPGAMKAILPEHTWAQCHNGVLWVADQASTPFGQGFILEGSYHIYDYHLFWMNIRENAQARVDAYFEAHPQTS